MTDKVNNSTPIYQKEKAIGLLSPLGIKAPSSKIPLLCDMFF